ncbi:MAG: GHMP kinase [Hyphomicrobiales bacterium]|nr:GHMP kinase [Hyphomicrobiales bacterium]
MCAATNHATAERAGAAQGARRAAAHVAASARLHLGFLDMNGSLGRMFGSLGMALAEPATEIELRPAAAFSATGEQSDRAERYLRAIAPTLAPDRAFALTVLRTIPPHAGLGSGTQMALAVSAAVRALTGAPRDTQADAMLTERGARSGIGAGLFTRGGFVVDAGRGPHTKTPPVVAHCAVPEEWRILLVQDSRVQGVHGEAERAAFAALPNFPESAAGETCRLALMQALPALYERDIAGFGAAIARIQQIVGDHFAPAQGGSRFTSAKVAAIVERLAAAGAYGCGQTSWGPTGFAFAEDEAQARELAARAGCAAAGPTIAIVRPLNRGATIAITPDATG